MWKCSKVGDDMKKNNSMTILFCGLATMIITFMFYLLIFNNIFILPIRWLSLLFLLIAEVIGAVKSLKVNRSILSITTVVVSAIHLLTVLVLSVVFVNVLPLLVKQYVLLNLIILAIVAIIDILLLYFDEIVNKSNQKHSHTIQTKK